MGIRFWRGPAAGLVALDAKLGGTIPIGVPHSALPGSYLATGDSLSTAWESGTGVILGTGNIVMAGEDTVVASGNTVIAGEVSQVVYQATGDSVSTASESGSGTVLTTVEGSVDLRVGSVADAAGFRAPSSWYTADPLYWTGSDVTQALRFTSVAIPAGATITSARLTVYSSANMAGATVNDEVRVHGEDVDNPTAISSSSDGQTRFANNKTIANVNWYVWEANGPLSNADQPVLSPSITAIVQEIVDRPGWVSGNAMMFFVEDLGTGQALSMRSYFNGAAGTYPHLEVDWTVNENPEPPGETQTLTYTQDTTTDFPNPERGWMTERQFTSSMYPTGMSIRNSYNQEVTVEFLYVDLLSYIGTDTIASSVLTVLQSSFDTARSTGKKVVLRFAYGRNSTNYCPALARVLLHIEQVAPTVNANKDVMLTLQTGMYGPWGEQWNTGSGETWWDTNASRRTFITKWLTELDSDIMVSMRYARDMMDYADATFTNQVLPEADRFNGSNQARFSLWTDSIVANDLWGDTWRESGTYNATQEKAYTAAQGHYTPVGGESSDIGGLNSVNDGSSSNTQFTAYQMDYLQSNFWVPIYDKWHTQGWLGTISRSLGYRLALNSVTAPTTVTAGANASLTFNMSNVGYGKVLTAKAIDLVFVGSGGPFTTRVTADARTNFPLGGETTEQTLSFTTPAGLVTGQLYALYLRFPDTDSGLASDNRYAIRLANTGIWNGATGQHNLNMSVTVQAEPEASLLGVGSTSTSLVDYPKIANATTGDWYVDASVASSGDGTTLGTAFKTLQEGLAALTSGDTLLVKGGTYVINSTIARNTNWATQTRIMGYDDDRPTLDFNGISARCITFGGSASNELWHGFYITNNNMVRDPGHTCNVHTGHEGMYATTGANNLVWSNIWASHLGGEGFRFYRAANCRVLDCAVWKIGDVSMGNKCVSCPDGYICSGNGDGTTAGASTNCVFARCVAVHCPDDGFDSFHGIDTLFVDCVALHPGWYYDGTVGRGRNGFKMGGGGGRDNTTKGSFAYCYGNNHSTRGGRGFEDNGGNLINFISGTVMGSSWASAVKNNSGGVTHDMISLASENSYPYSVSGTNTHNVWNLSITDAGYASPGTPNWDYSLGAGSACIAAGYQGDNLGASNIALELAKEWLAKNLT